MKLLAIASAFAAFTSGCFALLDDTLAAPKFSPDLKQLMVVVSKDRFVARDYGTFSLPKVTPPAYEEMATEKRGDM